MLPRATKETVEQLTAAFAKASLFSRSSSYSTKLIRDLGMIPIDNLGRRILAEWMSLLREAPPWAIAGPQGDDLVSTKRAIWWISLIQLDSLECLSYWTSRSKHPVPFTRSEHAG
jgi:hypothetical protein